MSATIRLASPADAAAIRRIYAPFCETSVVSFEYAAPPAVELARRIRATSARFPWLVLDDTGVLAGYAYASHHSERAAYAWSADATVYVSPSHQRRGVGRALYTTLFELLRLSGFFKVYAGIALPNPASTGLHEAMGFRLVGVYKGVGYKLGAWHDVAHYQLSLQPERADPEPPGPPSRLIETPGWADAVSLGMRHYRNATPESGV